MRSDVPIDEPAIADLVGRFYARVRQDAELGPLFNRAVADWDEHLEKLAAFWSSVMLGTGRYRGNPFQAHLRYGDAMSPALFERWLGLWRETTDECLPPAAAAAMQHRAARIAQSLQLGLFFRPGPSRGAPEAPVPQPASEG